MNSDHALYERKYRAFYDAGVPFCSATGYGSDFEAFLQGQEHCGRLIECGCGEGFAAAMAANLGYEVLGLDSAPSAVARAVETHCSARSNLQFRVADVCQGGWAEPGSCEIVVDIGCLHMIGSAEDARDYLRNTFIALAPGGRLFLQNRVSMEEAERWFPEMGNWIQQFAATHAPKTDTVAQTYDVDVRSVTVDVPVHLGQVSRDVAEHVSLATGAGYRIEHACVKHPGVNSPFELVLIAMKGGR